MFYGFQARRRRPSLETDLGPGLGVVRLELAELAATGAAFMVGETSDPAVIARAKRLGWSTWETDPRSPAPPAPARPASVAGSTLSPVVQAALRNGWAAQDIAGSGAGGQWGLEGGRGQASGLTAAELSISAPPPGWEEVRATKWPWEVLGWARPGLAWSAPALPPKVERVDAEVDPEEPPAPLPVNQEEEEEEEEPTADVPPADEPVAPPKGRTKPPPRPQTRTEEAMADLPPSDADAALAIIRELWEVRGKLPTPSRARYAAAKNDIPLTAAQVQSLLDRAQAEFAGA